MTLPKNKKLKHEHIESMKIAVEQAGIRAIHPDKMEEYAEHLVRKLKSEDNWNTDTGVLDWHPFFCIY